MANEGYAPLNTGSSKCERDVKETVQMKLRPKGVSAASHTVPCRAPETILTLRQAPVSPTVAQDNAAVHSSNAKDAKIRALESEVARLEAENKAWSGAASDLYSAASDAMVKKLE